MKKQIILISILSVLLVVAPADAQTNFFTYQGSLNDGANAANGNYDFEFRIYDAATNGNAIGGLITVTNRAVSNGVFSVDLLFGSGTFDGSDRYIDVRVRPTGVGSYVPLAPRQRVNSVPYALRSLAATTATNAATATNALQLGGIAANQYVTTTGGGTSFIQNTTSPQASSNFNISGSGTIGGNLTVNGLLNANLPAGDSSYVQNRTSVQTGSNFNVSGTGTANTFAATQFNGGNFSGALFAGSIFNSTNGFYQDNLRILSAPGNNNTFAGRLSGTANTGTDNSFFGFNAGNNNTSAVNNTFVGSEAGSLTTTGDVNTFIGAAAGKNNILGSENTFVGTAAGFTNSGGNQNTFVGRSAGRLNVSGLGNTFVGFEAGRATTTNYNSFFGHQSGDSNSTGSLNSFFGAAAGGSNVDGTGNSFFGRNAGLANTSGDYNSFFGNGAGDLNTSGLRNTFIGTDAGNTNTSGDDNTAVGNGADVGLSGLNYATAIGAGAVVSNSNTVVIGRSTDTVRILGPLRLPNITTVGFVIPGYLCTSEAGSLFRCPSPNDALNLCANAGTVYNTDSATKCAEIGSGEPKKVYINGANSNRNDIAFANAINEQQVQIDSQKKLIEQRNARIEALTKLVCAANKDAEICKEKLQ